MNYRQSVLSFITTSNLIKKLPAEPQKQIRLKYDQPFCCVDAVRAARDTLSDSIISITPPYAHRLLRFLTWSEDGFAVKSWRRALWGLTSGSKQRWVGDYLIVVDHVESRDTADGGSGCSGGASRSSSKEGEKVEELYVPAIDRNGNDLGWFLKVFPGSNRAYYSAAEILDDFIELSISHQVYCPRSIPCWQGEVRISFLPRRDERWHFELGGVMNERLERDVVTLKNHLRAVRDWPTPKIVHFLTSNDNERENMKPTSVEEDEEMIRLLGRDMLTEFNRGKRKE